jgi:hypothetical protein
MIRKCNSGLHNHLVTVSFCSDIEGTKNDVQKNRQHDKNIQIIAAYKKLACPKINAYNAPKIPETPIIKGYVSMVNFRSYKRIRSKNALKNKPVLPTSRNNKISRKIPNNNEGIKTQAFFIRNIRHSSTHSVKGNEKTPPSIKQENTASNNKATPIDIKQIIQTKK